MDDERIEHALKLGPVDEPAYQRGVQARIGGTANAAKQQVVAPTNDGPVLAPPTRIDVRRRVVARTSRTPRLATLGQLAAVLTIAAVAAAVALPALVGSPGASGDMLDRLRATGSIRMLVPDWAPQTLVTGGARIGFDIDVADALAEDLSIQPDVLPIDLDANPPASSWDLSLGLRDLGTSGASQPYAYWPLWLATEARSGLTTVDDVVGHPICVVGSSAAEGWLQELQPGAPAPSSGPEIVRTRSDDECIAALADGRAGALVTSTLLNDELASRDLVAIGSEPVAWEPRVVRISATGEDPGTLIAAIDRAIDELRTSGRLADLSRRSFGGRDLTQVTP